MYSPEQSFLAIIDKNSSSEVDLEQYIAGWDLLAEDPEYDKFKEFILKSTDFLKYLKNNGCKSYQDVLDSIQYRKIKPEIMKFFIEEGYISRSMKYYLRRGYPELKVNLTTN